MDEIYRILVRLIPILQQSLVELTDEEAEQIAQVLQAVTKYASDYQFEIPTPQGVDLLWILSGQEPNAFVNYLKTYPGMGFKELANDPARLANVIENLQRNSPLQQPQVDAQGIESTQYPSSNVAGMKYDPKTKRLFVKFHGENQEPIYQYDQVPPQIFYLLQHGNAFAKTQGKNKWGEWWPMKNPSIGAAVNQYLKQGGFAYQRVS